MVFVKHNRTYFISERRLLLPATTMQPETVTKPVAFYAYMSKTEASPSLHHTLLFDMVKTNVGGAYNPFTGVFTVPYDGIYAFSYTIHVPVIHGRQ